MRLLLLVTTDSLLFRDILFGTVNHEGVPSIGGMGVQGVCPLSAARDAPVPPSIPAPHFAGKIWF